MSCASLRLWAVLVFLLIAPPLFAEQPRDHLVWRLRDTVPGAPAGMGWIEYLPPSYQPDGHTALLIHLGRHQGDAVSMGADSSDGSQPVGMIWRGDTVQWPLDRPLAVFCLGTSVYTIPWWQQLHDFIAFAIDYYKLDPHCITLGGFSWAAGGVLDYYSHWAGDPIGNQVSGIVALGGTTYQAWPAQGPNLAGINLWQFCGSYDYTFGGNVGMARRNLDQVLAMPSPPRLGDVRLSVEPNVTHDPTSMFAGVQGAGGHDIYQWMLSKRRRLPGETAPAAGTLLFTAPMASRREGDAGTWTHAFTVSRTGGASGAVSVHYATHDGQASAADGDYIPAEGTLSWADGDASDRTITITVVGDTTPEADETVTVVLDSPTDGAELGTSTAELAIINDDNPAGIIAFLDGDRSVPEGAGGSSVHTFRVGRTRGSAGAVTVGCLVFQGFADDADSSPDVAGGNWRREVLTWDDGDSSERVISVEVLGDTLSELDESFQVSLFAPTGGTSLAGDACFVLLTIVNDDGILPPRVYLQPTSITTPAGEFASFQVGLWGRPDAAYQWETAPAGSDAFVAIPGATGSDYTVGPVTAALDATRYRCVVTNAVGSATSNAATLTVAAAGDAPPAVITQPQDRTVVAPAAATFTVTARGSQVLTYQWESSPPGSTVFTAIVGATSADCGTGATTEAMSGTRYRCVVTNAVGSVTSNPATLTVTAAGDAPPAVLTQPQDRTVVAPAAATFTVTASGSPTLRYQWESSPPGSTVFSAIVGATSADCGTGATTDAMSGTRYRCVVSNDHGTVTSSPATLTVTTATAPAGALQFMRADYRVAEGDTGTATVTIDVARVGGSAGAVQVRYAAGGGSATLGSDYAAAAGTLEWSDGDAGIRSFTVAVIGDRLTEGDETVALTLSDPTGGATLGSPATAILTIADDEATAAGTSGGTVSSLGQSSKVGHHGCGVGSGGGLGGAAALLVGLHGRRGRTERRH